MSQTSNNLLHDQSYACLNGLMFNNNSSFLNGSTPVNNPIMTGLPNSSVAPQSNPNAAQNTPASTKPYTMDDYLNDINQKDGFESQNNQTVEDGVDDGKISFKAKMKNFGKGLISPITNIIKHPIASAAALALGAVAIVATGGAIAPLLIGLGVGMGAFKIGSGIYKQATAKTDAQAESAWQSIGSGTTDIGLSVLGSKKALKAPGVTPQGGFFKSTIQCFKSIPSACKNSYTAIKNGAFLSGIKNLFSRFNGKRNTQSANEVETTTTREAKSALQEKKGTTTTHETQADGTKVDTRYLKNKVRSQKTTTPDGDSIEIKYTNGQRPSEITTKVDGHKVSKTKIRYDNKTYEEIGRVTTDSKTGEIADIKFADGKGGYSNAPKGYEIQEVNGQKVIKDVRTYSERIADENLAKIKAGQTKKSPVAEMIDKAIAENPNGEFAKIRAAKTKLDSAMQSQAQSPKNSKVDVPTKKPNNIKLGGKNVSQGTYRRFS